MMQTNSVTEVALLERSFETTLCLSIVENVGYESRRQ